MSSAKPDDMGPLPKYKRQAVLQRLSIQALTGFLPADRFLFRGEPGEDAGVDGELEVLFTENFANCRSKVQLKATDDQSTNQDGSVSLSVETSNLNYLLNGPSPLYILYIEPRKELRYAWARDEFKRVEASTPNWKNQESITLRFSVTLDPAALDQIHDRILHEARFNRQVADFLGRAGDVEQVSMHINPQTLAITDPAQIRALLLQNGNTIVGAGFARQVTELAALLNPSDRMLPRIQLILANAYYQQSKLHTAYGHVQEALIRQAELSEDDRDFLIFLRDGIDHESGKITLAEYTKRRDRWSSSAKSHFAQVHRLECLSHELISKVGTDEVPQIIEAIRATALAIGGDPQSSNLLKLQARLKVAYADGVQLIRLFASEISISHMRASMSRTQNPMATLESLWDRYLEWEQKLESLFQETLETAHRRLLGDVAISRAIVRFIYLSNLRFVTLPDRLAPIPQSLIDKAMADARLAIDLYQHSGYLLGELRAKMLLADYLELSGDQAASRSLATDTLPIAQAMGFAGVEEHVTGQAEGKSLLSQADATIARCKSVDEDVLLAGESDAKMHAFAQATMKALELPPERFSVVLRECFALRAAAREAVHWCRHFELIQDLRHTDRHETHYLTDPQRFGACVKHRTRAAIGCADPETAIRSFKEARCAGCLDRSPKSVDA